MCSLVHCARSVSINLFPVLIDIIRINFDGLVSEPLDFAFNLLLRSQLLAGLLDLIDRNLDTGVRIIFDVDIFERFEIVIKSYGHVQPIHLLSFFIENRFHLQVWGASIIIFE